MSRKGSWGRRLKLRSITYSPDYYLDDDHDDGGGDDGGDDGGGEGGDERVM